MYVLLDSLADASTRDEGACGADKIEFSKNPCSDDEYSSGEIFLLEHFLSKSSCPQN